MSVQTSKKTTTYRTMKVTSPEPVTSTVISARSVSPLPYALNGSYETVRYLVPMQQEMQQQYIPVQQAMQQQQYIPVQQGMQQQYVLMQQPVIQQPVMQQVVSPMYLQRLSHLSVSSQESDLLYQQQSTVESISGQSSSVFSQSSSPLKSPEPSAEEEGCVSV